MLLAVAGCSFQPIAASSDATTSPDSGSPGDGTGDPDAAGVSCLERWKTGPLALATPTPLPNVNSSSEDRDPYLTGDERTLYFASRRTGSQGADVYVALRALPDGAFPAPAKAQDFDSSSDDTKMTLSGDGLLAFVSSMRGGGEGNADLWQASRTATTTPFTSFDQAQLAAVNDTDFQLDPAISVDGLTLYFATGVSPQRIVVSRRAAIADDFPAPQPLISSGAGDADPAISADELVIVFASNRTGSGFGGGNLWYATRAAKTDPFGEPQPVPNVNTNNNDSDPMLSRDGCRLYFAADGGIAGYELMVADVVP
ncbi:MAG TPA: hypothetical protein VFQ53_19720 [Kofleriaceae bacterium]|nr:hypothetical protein [Kofleriaceae bacterium]